MTPARSFILCFDAHSATGRVWAVRVGRTWRTTRDVRCTVPLKTVYRGPSARQPRAYLAGVGRVRGTSAQIRITP